MKKKRGLKIKLSNRWLYFFITLGILAIVAVGVYAWPASGAGHNGNEINVDNTLCNAVTGHKCGYDLGGLWSTSGSNIYRSSGNVGIGTTNPTEKLHVVEKIRIGNTQIWDNEINRYDNDNLYIGYRNTANTILQVNGGNVGIGTLSPTQKLDVNGNANIGGALIASSVIAAGTVVTPGGTCSIWGEIARCGSGTFSAAGVCACAQANFGSPMTWRIIT